MKKNLWVLIVCLLLITSTFTFISSTIEPEKNVRANEAAVTKDCGCGLEDESVSQEPVRTQILVDETVGESGRPAPASDLPASFSWLDMNGSDWTTPAKDQGSCGSCWDFAAIGALESIIQIQEGCPGLRLDLSEQYVLSCLHAAGSCKGGWAYNAFKYIKSNSSAGNFCNGIIPEFCFPYQVNDDVPCANASPDWRSFLIPITNYGRWAANGSAQARDVIKTQVMTFGPVAATMLCTYYIHGDGNLEEWGYMHHDPTEYYAYPGPYTGTNHQVVIVGWKDDASIPHGGYWIVKNSFGPEWGYDGFFNLEYGSLRIDAADIDWVEYNPANYSNWVPVAQIVTQGAASMDQAITFNGSTSFDHEGSIVSYQWDLGDGTSQPGPVVSHLYASPGIYRVTLTVTDNDNNTGSQSVWAYVDKVNHPPKTPTLRGRRYVQPNETYSYTFFSADPDGDDVSYYLNWGDTYWFGGAAGWLGPYHSGQKVTLDKNWTDKANYTVRVKAADQYGAKSGWATLKVSSSAVSVVPENGFWAQFFERFPHAFPVLRRLLGY